MNGTTIAEALFELANRPTSPATAGNVVKASEEMRVAWFVVYSPNRLPLRGADHKIDVASPDVLEKACHKFAENGFHIGVGHQPGGEGIASVLENYIHRGGDWRSVGPDGTTEVVKSGDWVIALRFTPKGWARFKSGEWGGVSLQGSATRKPASAATLARQGR